ncbi:MAG: hypothetical protein Q9209_006376 [Squamulea sp. 1 TL-2023]
MVSYLPHIGVYHPFNDIMIETTLINLANFIVPAEATGAGNTGVMRNMNESAGRAHLPVHTFHDEAEEEETDEDVNKEEADAEVCKEEADAEMYKEEADEVVFKREEDTDS